MPQVHATCIAVDGRGILVRGPSGCGKSDLALRLIDAGARLVADDRVDVHLDAGRAWARAPAEIAGLLEVRGVGVVRLEAMAEAPLELIVELVAPDDVERCPDPAACGDLGVSLPLLRLDPFAASAAAKVRLAVGSETRE